MNENIIRKRLYEEKKMGAMCVKYVKIDGEGQKEGVRASFLTNPCENSFNTTS